MGPTAGMLIISLCLRSNPQPRSWLANTLFGCAMAGGVTGAVEYLGFSPVQENKFDTLRLTSEFWSEGTLTDTLASSVPNLGSTPEFVPERK